MTHIRPGMSQDLRGSKRVKRYKEIQRDVRNCREMSKGKVPALSL